jgi:hypothetical protein
MLMTEPHRPVIKNFVLRVTTAIALTVGSVGACASEAAPQEQPVQPDAFDAPEESDEDVEEEAGARRDAGAKRDAGPSGHDASVVDASAGPCGSTPVDGICTSSTQLALCALPTGQGVPSVVTKTCPSYAECKLAQGKARCVPRAGRCEPGSSECLSATQQRTCDGNGNWVQEACPGCATTSFGALCTATTTTFAYSGRVNYAVRGPNETLTDWSPTTHSAPAQGALVVSYAWDTTNGSYRPIDSVVTDSSGAYTIAIAATPHPKDLVVVWAIRTSPAGILFGVATPDIPDGQQDVASPIPAGGTNANWWGWSQSVQSLGPPGSTFTITDVAGSGAMRVFDYLRYSYDATASVLGGTPKSIVGWLRYNTSWNCGACFMSAPTVFLGHSFESQMWLPATVQNQTYWSDAVTAHELGHWVMASYGKMPVEAGPHSPPCTTYPGQAWLEGWATGFSSLARGQSVYYDKQGGTFFWFDIAQRLYSSGQSSPAPNPSLGLLQKMDENVVASMIWALADSATQPGLAISANAPLFSALTSTRMTQAPYARGYIASRWSGTCSQTGVVSTGISTPMVADYLDALVCAGMPAAKVASAVGTYPFSASAPICN